MAPSLDKLKRLFRRLRPEPRRKTIVTEKTSIYNKDLSIPKPPFLSTSWRPIDLDNSASGRSTGESPFFRLPAELRRMIYKFAFETNSRVHIELSYTGRELCPRSVSCQCGYTFHDVGWFWQSCVCDDPGAPIDRSKGDWEDQCRTIVYPSPLHRTDGIWEDGSWQDQCICSRRYGRDSCLNSPEIVGKRRVAGIGLLLTCKRAYSEGLEFLYGRAFVLSPVMVYNGKWFGTEPYNLAEMLPMLWGEKVKWITSLNFQWDLLQGAPLMRLRSDRKFNTCWKEYADFWESALVRFERLQWLTIEVLYQTRDYSCLRKSTSCFAEFGLERGPLCIGPNSDDDSWKAIAEQLETALCGPVEDFILKGAVKGLQGMRLALSPKLMRPLMHLVGDGRPGWEKRDIKYAETEEEFGYQLRQLEVGWEKRPVAVQEFFRIVCRPETFASGAIGINGELSSSAQDSTCGGGLKKGDCHLSGFFVCTMRDWKDEYYEYQPYIQLSCLGGPPQD